MKHQIIYLIALLCVGTGLLSCSDTENENPVIPQAGDLQIGLRAESTQLPSELKTTIYVFSKSGAGQDYTFKRTISMENKMFDRYPYIETEWPDDLYRFLFIAQKGEEESIQVSNMDAWSNVQITANEMNLPGDLYYDIVDKARSEIIADNRSIDGELTRLVGQVVLDIYRGEDVALPEDIRDAEVMSVLDRVSAIEITYSGLSNAIRFNESGDVIPISTYAEDVVVPYTIDAQDEFWRVPVTETDQNNPFLTPAAAGTAGSVRIGGIFGFPADQTVRVRAIFRYHDTTAHCNQLVHTHERFCHDRGDITRPITCTIPVHEHTRECGYDDRSIELNLPADDSSELLTILPNMYTVNKAAIRYDRIIDVTRSGDFTMDLDWVLNE